MNTGNPGATIQLLRWIVALFRWIVALFFRSIHALYQYVDNRWDIAKPLALIVISICLIIMKFAPFSIFPSIYQHVFTPHHLAGSSIFPSVKPFPRGWTPTPHNLFPSSHQYAIHWQEWMKGLTNTTESAIVFSVFLVSAKQLFRWRVSNNNLPPSRDEQFNKWRSLK